MGVMSIWPMMGGMRLRNRFKYGSVTYASPIGLAIASVSASLRQDPPRELAARTDEVQRRATLRSTGVAAWDRQTNHMHSRLRD
jgi:hypothetical protein